MAVTAADAGYGTVDDTGQQVLTNGGTTVYVSCLSTSSNSALVNIPVLHGTSYFQLLAGQSFVGRFQEGLGISQMNVKATDNSAAATISWAVASRT